MQLAYSIGKLRFYRGLATAIFVTFLDLVATAGSLLWHVMGVALVVEKRFGRILDEQQRFIVDSSLISLYDCVIEVCALCAARLVARVTSKSCGCYRSRLRPVPLSLRFRIVIARERL